VPSKPLIAFAALLATLPVLAACGSTDSSVDPGPSITGAQVTREFQQETGRRLQEAAGTDPAWEQLSFGLNPGPELRREYGVFSVYVVEAGNEEAVDSLLSDKATGDPLEPDGRGIRWEEDSLSRTWIAYKLYGENVVLAWFSEAKRPVTDARWSRLDRILSGLAA
jgi:hypothetical protein